MARINRKYSDEIYEKVGLVPFFDEYSRQWKVKQLQDNFVYSMNHYNEFSVSNWIDKQISYYIEKGIV